MFSAVQAYFSHPLMGVTMLDVARLVWITIRRKTGTTRPILNDI